MSFFTVLTYTDTCGLCALCVLYFHWKLEQWEKKKMKMVIFSEGPAVSGSWDIVLFSRAVKTCGLHRRGNCSCGQRIVYVLDTGRRIVWLVLFLELHGREVNTNRNIVGLIAEMLSSNSTTELTDGSGWGCGFGQSWASPVIWDLWVFVITAVKSQVLMHAVFTWSTPVREIMGFKSGIFGASSFLVSVSCKWPKARNVYAHAFRLWTVPSPNFTFTFIFSSITWQQTRAGSDVLRCSQISKTEMVALHRFIHTSFTPLHCGQSLYFFIICGCHGCQISEESCSEF